MPSSIQRHEFAASVAHVVASPWPAHASATSSGALPGVAAGDAVEPLPLIPTLPAPHAQSHGAQLAPGAHAGQAQVQVPPPPEPVPVQVLRPSALQSQLHG